MAVHILDAAGPDVYNFDIHLEVGWRRMRSLSEFETILWDASIVRKLWEKHKIMAFEVEEVLTKPVLGPAPDVRHSKKEARYAVVGVTDQNKYLRVVYIEAGKSIKIIHARKASKELIIRYEKAVEDIEKKL